jgi:DNA helicase IV
MTDAVALFPDLSAEQLHLRSSRHHRERMITQLLAAIEHHTAADEITQEYVEMTVEEAVVDLRSPGAGDFFGRIDDEDGDRWYVGRRHIEDELHNPLVVDWRAGIAAPFYRATGIDPLGLIFRRRFMMTEGDITSYLDEHLDDADESGVGSGIPDPVLAEIGAARTGAMREIVATIQGEQDVVIRSPLEGCLVVQGGPGTGKTAVGLHRAAYLLFQHRRELVRTGVLVVGPNRVFLDYISNVLPSLGERSVQQQTLLDMCLPKVPVDGDDTVAVARLKGDARMAEVIARAARLSITPPVTAVRLPLGVRTVVIEPDEMADWIERALNSAVPINRRRVGLKAIMTNELRRRTGKDAAKADALRQALDKAWPLLQPKALVERLLGNAEVLAAAADGLYSPAEQELLLTRTGRKKAWTPADQVLVDEANNQLNGPTSTVGHIVVDEAQDLSALALVALGRRCPSQSFTILGDLAQSTGAAGQSDWADVLRYLGAPPAQNRVEHLTVGYRVPAPVLEVANRLLPMTGVTVPASRSARTDGAAPVTHLCAADELATTVVSALTELKHKHRLAAVIVPDRVRSAVEDALRAAGWEPVNRVQDVGRMDVPVFSPEAVKGLEFDGVVLVNPGEILDETTRGARVLYVAMTRAVQDLILVSEMELPAILR